MKSILIVLGLLLGAAIGFKLGLIPGEMILASDHFAQTESYILIGTGRIASQITGMLEFALGVLVAVLWIKLIKKKAITEQKDASIPAPPDK